MSLTVFYSSVSGNLEMNKNQQWIFFVLDGKKIPYTKIDVCTDSAHLDQMRKIAGNPDALPPQICNGDLYCGDMTAFEKAIEAEILDDFLKLSQTKCT